MSEGWLASVIAAFAHVLFTTLPFSKCPCMAYGLPVVRFTRSAAIGSKILVTVCRLPFVLGNPFSKWSAETQETQVSSFNSLITFASEFHQFKLVVIHLIPMQYSNYSTYFFDSRKKPQVLHTHKKVQRSPQYRPNKWNGHKKFVGSQSKFGFRSHVVSVTWKLFNSKPFYVLWRD